MKEKAPSGNSSKSAKKTLFHELEGIEAEISGFMAQVLDLLRKLNEKVDNMSTRLLLLERKMRELTKEVRARRGTMVEEEEDEENKEDEEEEKRR